MIIVIGPSQLTILAFPVLPTPWPFCFYVVQSPLAIFFILFSSSMWLLAQFTSSIVILAYTVLSIRNYFFIQFNTHTFYNCLYTLTIFHESENSTHHDVPQSLFAKLNDQTPRVRWLLLQINFIKNTSCSVYTHVCPMPRPEQRDQELSAGHIVQWILADDRSSCYTSSVRHINGYVHCSLQN